MYMFPFLLAIVLFGARANTAYDPALLFKRYITIRKVTTARILISQQDVTASRLNKKADRNKLLLAGVVFYCLNGLLLLLSIVLLCFVPPLSAASFEVDTRFLFLSASTLNEKIVITLALLLLAGEGTFYFLNTIKSNVSKANSPKAAVGINVSLIVFLFIGTIYAAAQFLSCFLYG